MGLNFFRHFKVSLTDRLRLSFAVIKVWRYHISALVDQHASQSVRIIKSKFPIFRIDLRLAPGLS